MTNNRKKDVKLNAFLKPLNFLAHVCNEKIESLLAFVLFILCHLRYHLKLHIQYKNIHASDGTKTAITLNPFGAEVQGQQTWDFSLEGPCPCARARPGEK